MLLLIIKCLQSFSFMYFERGGCLLYIYGTLDHGFAIFILIGRSVPGILKEGYHQYICGTYTMVLLLLY